MKYSAPKGTFDITPQSLKEEDFWKTANPWQYIEQITKNCAQDYGFREIRTPIFEKTELFIRSVGDTSDIISKEMYTFNDKAKRSMSLRPEGTAPIIRAFIENHLQQQGQVHKLYYFGPFFRYDRPQAGRFRQFHQFGVEAIGRNDPFQDVEVIDLCMQIYHRLGLKNLNVLINSVGDAASREAYKKSLLNYLKPHYDELSEDSKTRFSKNPLRILDSKDPKDQELLKDCPSLYNFLSEESKKHFDTVCENLSKLNLNFKITPNLVRGLDYYNETVFEVTSTVLGAQNSIGAGGRYNGLMKDLGGPDLPSIGFATGIERIIQTMLGQQCSFGEDTTPYVYIIPLGEESFSEAFSLLCQLRRMKIPAEISYKVKKMQKALQEASLSKARYSLIIGDEELRTGQVQVKNMSSRESENVSLSNVLNYIQKLSTSST